MTHEEYQAEYERLFLWRERWTRLSNKRELNRLAVRQERIEERAAIANNRIGALMRDYDAEHPGWRRHPKGTTLCDSPPISL